MAQLTDEQLEFAGEAFAMLQRVFNLEDLQRANVCPLRVIKEYHNESYSYRSLTNEEESLMSKFYDSFTLKKWHERFDSPLASDQQGVFNMAYAEARSQSKQPKRKKDRQR